MYWIGYTCQTKTDLNLPNNISLFDSSGIRTPFSYRKVGWDDRPIGPWPWKLLHWAAATPRKVGNFVENRFVTMDSHSNSAKWNQHATSNNETTRWSTLLKFMLRRAQLIRLKTSSPWPMVCFDHVRGDGDDYNILWENPMIFHPKNEYNAQTLKIICCDVIVVWNCQSPMCIMEKCRNHCHMYMYCICLCVVFLNWKHIIRNVNLPLEMRHQPGLVTPQPSKITCKNNIPVMVWWMFNMFYMVLHWNIESGAPGLSFDFKTSNATLMQIARPNTWLPQPDAIPLAIRPEPARVVPKKEWKA